MTSDRISWRRRRNEIPNNKRKKNHRNLVESSGNRCQCCHTHWSHWKALFVAQWRALFHFYWHRLLGSRPVFLVIFLVRLGSTEMSDWTLNMTTFFYSISTLRKKTKWLLLVSHLQFYNFSFQSIVFFGYYWVSLQISEITELRVVFVSFT